MSEIRSIAEGTFVIGDTNGLTFEAGTGISVSQPSEGTVRIANDETVLWSGTPSTSDITLSEAATNFEFIRVFGKWHYNATEDSGRGIDITDEELIPTSAISFTLFGIGLESLTSTNSVYMTAVDYRIDGSTLSRRAGIRMKYNGTNPSNTDTIEAYKVIGINRKENA